MKKLLYLHIPLPSLTIGRVMTALSILGIGGLCYLYGAAVMFFQLPSSAFLDKSFRGAKAWQERGRSTIPLLDLEEVDEFRKRGGTRVDQAEKTWDGFTLYTTTGGARATLIDMRGTLVHRWELPFRQVWPHAPHVKDPLPDDQIHWFHCYLYPNGDLLAVYHVDGDTPYGYGLVKLNKNSKLLWAYANNVHHDVDVGEDGTIYTLAQQIVSEPPAGLDFLPTPYGADSLVILSPEGRELESIPLAEAFVNSPYALILATDNNVLTPFGYGPSATPAVNPSPPPGFTRQKLDHKSEFLHTNSVKVLKGAQAAKFPLFQTGQVLLSLRNLNTIAVLDRHTRSVVWAARGVWKAQHDAEFLENGHLLLYDNYGNQKYTRVVEFDPRTQALPWAYNGENSNSWVAFYRGMKQRLPNDNTLIVDPDARRLLEVTHEKEVVWEKFCPLPTTSPGERPQRHAVTSARRYRADELTFLNGKARARP
jgi:hypothetical protein